jgi:hypothetical protein
VSCPPNTVQCYQSPCFARCVMPMFLHFCMLSSLFRHGFAVSTMLACLQVSGEYYRRQLRDSTLCLGEETAHRSVMLVQPIGCLCSFQQSGFKATFTVPYCLLSCYPQHELRDSPFKTYIMLRHRGAILRASL